MDLFEQYIKQNIKYPISALINGISGTVIIRFLVNYHGEVVFPEILEESIKILISKHSGSYLIHQIGFPVGKEICHVMF